MTEQGLETERVPVHTFFLRDQWGDILNVTLDPGELKAQGKISSRESTLFKYEGIISSSIKLTEKLPTDSIIVLDHTGDGKIKYWKVTNPPNKEYSDHFPNSVWVEPINAPKETNHKQYYITTLPLTEEVKRKLQIQSSETQS